VTLNLSEAKNHGCRPHPRGSVRRASGFVLTGKPVVTHPLTPSSEIDGPYNWQRPAPVGVRLSSAILTTPHRRSAIKIRNDTFLQPPFASLCRISGANRSSNSSNVKLSSMANSPRSESVMINRGPF
jgi:hypothetical protein